MWKPGNRPRNLRRILAKPDLVEPLDKSVIVTDLEVSVASEEDVASMKVGHILLLISNLLHV